MDRFTEMDVFTAIVEEGGFTGAARKLGLSKSAVSKHITALEGRLGATLLNRTTRQVNPTEVGQQFYTQAKSILKDTRDAEDLVSSMQSEPMGLLRISAANDFGVNQLAKPISKFLCSYPKIQVDLTLDNRFVDILAEGIDLAFRIGTLSDSSLKARKLAETQSVILAAPSYIEKHGMPQSIADLAQHNLLHYANSKGDHFWRLKDESGQMVQVPVKTSFTVNDGKTLMEAAIEGVGLTMLPCFVYTDAFRAGKLVKVLPNLKPNILGVYAVYPPGDFMQPKLRAMIDFMITEFRDKGRENW
ncbi:MAG: LysR family transcriptional regulator [Pseudomonadota bacterium]